MTADKLETARNPKSPRPTREAEYMYNRIHMVYYVQFAHVSSSRKNPLEETPGHILGCIRTIHFQLYLYFTVLGGA